MRAHSALVALTVLAVAAAPVQAAPATSSSQVTVVSQGRAEPSTADLTRYDATFVPGARGEFRCATYAMTDAGHVIASCDDKPPVLYRKGAPVKLSATSRHTYGDGVFTDVTWDTVLPTAVNSAGWVAGSVNRAENGQRLRAYARWAPDGTLHTLGGEAYHDSYLFRTTSVYHLDAAGNAVIHSQCLVRVWRVDGSVEDIPSIAPSPGLPDTSKSQGAGITADGEVMTLVGQHGGWYGHRGQPYRWRPGSAPVKATTAVIGVQGGDQQQGWNPTIVPRAVSPSGTHVVGVAFEPQHPVRIHATAAPTRLPLMPEDRSWVPLSVNDAGTIVSTEAAIFADDSVAMLAEKTDGIAAGDSVRPSVITPHGSILATVSTANGASRVAVLTPKRVADPRAQTPAQAPKFSAYVMPKDVPGRPGGASGNTAGCYVGDINDRYEMAANCDNVGGIIRRGTFSPVALTDGTQTFKRASVSRINRDGIVAGAVELVTPIPHDSTAPGPKPTQAIRQSPSTTLPAPPAPTGGPVRPTPQPPGPGGPTRPTPQPPGPGGPGPGGPGPGGPGPGGPSPMPPIPPTQWRLAVWDAAGKLKVAPVIALVKPDISSFTDAGVVVGATQEVYPRLRSYGVTWNSGTGAIGTTEVGAHVDQGGTVYSSHFFDLAFFTDVMIHPSQDKGVQAAVPDSWLQCGGLTRVSVSAVSSSGAHVVGSCAGMRMGAVLHPGEAAATLVPSLKSFVGVSDLGMRVEPTRVDWSGKRFDLDSLLVGVPAGETVEAQRVTPRGVMLGTLYHDSMGLQRQAPTYVILTPMKAQ